jgi:hypothetical protein
MQATKPMDKSVQIIRELLHRSEAILRQLQLFPGTQMGLKFSFTPSLSAWASNLWSF